MSGYKRTTVSVDSDTLNRLQQSENELRRFRSDLPDVLRNLESQRLGDLQQRMEPFRQRQDAFDQSINHLHVEVRNVERETAKRLQEQQRKFTKELEKQEKRFHQEINALASETERMMQEERRIREQQMRQVAEAIEAESQQRQQDVAHLTGEINQVRNDIKAKEEIRKDIASRWISDAETMRDAIKQHFRHEKFAPNRLVAIEREIQHARENVNKGIPEPAISQAQSAYWQLSDLHVELVCLEKEWELWRSAALSASRELFAIARENRKCKALDMNGQPAKDEQGKDIDLEVDWWTSGRLTKLEQDIQAVAQKIEKEGAALTTQELQAFAETRVQELQKQLAQIIYDARLAVISSQLRFGIADVVVETLTQKGFDLNDETYEKDDMRTGFVTKVRRPNGDEIVIRVVPKKDNIAESDVEIHSYDAEQRSEEELQQRRQELNDALRERGLAVTKTEELSKKPEPQWQQDVFQEAEIIRHQKEIPQR